MNNLLLKFLASRGISRQPSDSKPFFVVLRMLFLSLCTLVIFSYSNAYADEVQVQGQTAKLEQSLAQMAELDPKRLPVLIELIKTLRRSEPQQALLYAEEGLTILARHPNFGHEALLVGYMTKIYLERGELTTAETLIERGLAAGRQADDPQGLTVNLFNRALVYHLSNKLVLAINSYQALAQAYQLQDDVAGLAAAYNNMGNVYRILGNLDDALAYYQKALPFYEGAENQTHYANTVMNIGQLFFLINDFEQAEQNYRKGLAVISPDSAPLSYSEGLQRLAIMHMSLEQFDKAEALLTKALMIAEQKELKGAQLSIHYELIKLAQKANHMDILSASLIKAESLITPDMHPATKFSIHYFRALGALAQNEVSLAERSIDSLFSNKGYQSRFYEMQEALDLAVEIKSKLGKYTEVNQLISESFRRYQSQQEESRSSLLAQYAQLYKTNEKERELSRLKQINIQQEFDRLQAQQKTRLMAFIFVVVFIVLLASAIFIWQRSQSLMRENQLNVRLMAEKKQFFADISHELRTPLTVFKLKMEELEYDIADDPQSVYALLHERIEGFSQLINDISELAKSDQGELELNCQNVDLLTFFTRRKEELIALASMSELQTEVDIQLDVKATACFDSDRIRQVLNNLFSNNCRYTHSPGRIRFAVSQAKGKLLIVIEDSAPGMSNHELEKAFDRLYRADQSRSRKLGGSGLGLSICQGLVNAHKGEITATPSELGGVKFTIELPLS